MQLLVEPRRDIVLGREGSVEASGDSCHGVAVLLLQGLSRRAVLTSGSLVAKGMPAMLPT